MITKVEEVVKPGKKLRSLFFQVTLFLVLFFLLDFSIYAVLKKGVIKYYGLDKDARILCVGCSHMVLGVDAEKLERELGMPTARYAVAGANVTDRLWMIRHALNLQPGIKLVVYDVDARMFDAEGLSSASYTLFLPFADDDIMEEYLRNYASWQEFYTAKFIRTARFRDQTLNIALRGLLNRSENKKKSTIRLEQYKGYLERERKRKIRMTADGVKCFEETLDLLNDHGVKVVLLYIPIIDLLNDPERGTHDHVVHIIESMARAHPNVFFLNYNAEYEHNHELFFDPRHLNEKGNEVVTSRLINDIRKICM